VENFSRLNFNKLANPSHFASQQGEEIGAAVSTLGAWTIGGRDYGKKAYRIWIAIAIRVLALLGAA
jgi:hypothetical protein